MPPLLRRRFMRPRPVQGHRDRPFDGSARLLASLRAPLTGAGWTAPWASLRLLARLPLWTAGDTALNGALLRVPGSVFVAGGSNRVQWRARSCRPVIALRHAVFHACGDGSLNVEAPTRSWLRGRKWLDEGCDAPAQRGVERRERIATRRGRWRGRAVVTHGLCRDGPGPRGPQRARPPSARAWSRTRVAGTARLTRARESSVSLMLWLRA